MIALRLILTRVMDVIWLERMTDYARVSLGTGNASANIS